MTKMIPASWTLPEPLTSRLGHGAGRQRLIEEEGHALLVLHRPPIEGEKERRPFVLWRDANGGWRAAAEGRDGMGGDGLSALRQHLIAFSERLAELDARSDAARSAAEHFEVLAAAQPLHRTARNAHRAIQSLRDALPDEAALVSLRDRAYQLERTAELLAEDTRNRLDLLVATQAEAQSRTASAIAEESRRLNRIAAICLPLSALSAVVGASVPTGLERLGSPLFFWLLIAGAVAVGVVLRRSIAAA